MNTRRIHASGAPPDLPVTDFSTKIFPTTTNHSLGCPHQPRHTAGRPGHRHPRRASAWQPKYTRTRAHAHGPESMLAVPQDLSVRKQEALDSRSLRTRPSHSPRHTRYVIPCHTSSQRVMLSRGMYRQPCLVRRGWLVQGQAQGQIHNKPNPAVKIHNCRRRSKYSVATDTTTMASPFVQSTRTMTRTPASSRIPKTALTGSAGRSSRSRYVL